MLSLLNIVFVVLALMLSSGFGSCLCIETSFFYEYRDSLLL